MEAFIKNSPENSVFHSPFKNYQVVKVAFIQQQKLTEQANLIISNHVLVLIKNPIVF